MAVRSSGDALTFLRMVSRRAGLLGLILAITVGILGMHVLAADHSSHGGHGAISAQPSHASRADHEADHEADHGAASSHHPADVPTATAESCSLGDCAARHAMTVSCTPSAKKASLTAPLPGSTTIIVPPGYRFGGPVTGDYWYLPGTPSPLELSISRT
ncbi:hypothetical protein [Arthrobacter sp. ISL-72]|uniref:hypothetical protein n=1 Tax=Arthrobacter sp. ISL-72 TaxID=2819114 RepID=UPI001BE9BC87|nr:hypothetical protein [Arthrobacter sp. ISL-72]MBT2595637.1 hypothetical protein [Arthrobacter sp. ISL-72]